MRYTFTLLAALCLAVALGQTVWPKPSSMTGGSTQLTVSTSLAIVDKNSVGAPLTDAIKRYNALVFYLGKQAVQAEANVAASVTTLSITVKSANATLALATDESYTLTVASPTSTIVAETSFGAMRALETFSQLVYYTGGQYTIKDYVVNDSPRFHHRGIMIDTSRHWLPLLTIYQMLDAMAYSKFNVLHWHIVDSQSFPYESAVYPLLSQKGAWSPTHVYSAQDIKNIVDYAYARGIRVIPEFDTPGHTECWANGYPELLTQCYDNGKPTNRRYAVNPIEDYSYTFMKNLFGEIAQRFPDDYVHVGGDEVNFNCWKSNPDIQKFVQSKGWTDYSQLEQYYENNLLEIVGGLGKNYVVWEDVFDNGVKLLPNTVVHVWKGTWTTTVARSTAAGYKTILSQPWYLNYISYGSDWHKYYTVEPHDFNGTPAQKALVFGGEACFWGEFIDDTNLVSRAWVRASAIAERLWSPQSVNNTGEASGRLHTFRCRLLQRDINAEEPNGPNFCEHEFKPHYTQPWEA